MVQAKYPYIKSSAAMCQVAVLLGVIEGQALFRVGAGRGKLTEIKQGGCERRMGLQHEGDVVLVLGQGEALVPQLPRGLQLPPCIIKLPQSPQHREEPRRLVHLCAQHARPRVDLLHLGGPWALDGDQCRAQGNPQVELLLCPRWGVGEQLQDLCVPRSPISAGRISATIRDETMQFLPRKSDDLRRKG